MERLFAVVVPDGDLFAIGGWSTPAICFASTRRTDGPLPAGKRVQGYDLWFEPLPRTTTGKLKGHEIARRVRRAPSVLIDRETTATLEHAEHWERRPAACRVIRAPPCSTAGRFARREPRARPRTRLDGTGRAPYRARAALWCESRGTAAHQMLTVAILSTRWPRAVTAPVAPELDARSYHGRSCCEICHPPTIRCWRLLRRAR